MPSDLEADLPIIEGNNADAEQFYDRMKGILDAWAQVHGDNSLQYAPKTKFKVGDEVWLSTKKHSRLLAQLAVHLRPKWVGPFKIVSVTNETYRLDMSHIGTFTLCLLPAC